jgi:eukaryotic-like serine/threonine-protein kinase
LSPATDEDDEGPLKTGQTFISKYEILERIGRGGYAFVYEARHRFMGHHVAIKVLHRAGGVSQHVLRRGQAEAQIQKGLRHPNIVEIDDAGLSDDGQLYIVMERLRGRLWRDALTEYGRFEVEEVLHLAAQLADGVHAAHERGVVHRDLKPDNAFLTKGNGLKVLDFGVAKLADAAAWATQKDMVLGTIYYMSPEQILAQPITARSDIYALGIMMYEALLGEHPVARLLGPSEPNMYSFTRIIVTEPMPPLDELDARIPRYVADLVNTATDKKAEWRFNSMAEFAVEIRECLANYREETLRRGGTLQTRDLSRAPKANSGVEVKEPTEAPREPTPPRLLSGAHDTDPASRPLFFGAVASDILALQQKAATPPTPSPQSASAAPPTPAPRSAARQTPAPVASERPTVWSRPGQAPSGLPGSAPPASRPPLQDVRSRTLTDVAIPAVSPPNVAERPRAASTPPPTSSAATPSPAAPVFEQPAPVAKKPPSTLVRALIAGAVVGFTTFGAGALYFPSQKASRPISPSATAPAAVPLLPPTVADPAPSPAPPPPTPDEATPTPSEAARPVINPAPARQIVPLAAPRPATTRPPSRTSSNVGSGLPFDEEPEAPEVKPAKPATKAKPVDKMDERMRRLEQALDKKKSGAGRTPWDPE